MHRYLFPSLLPISYQRSNSDTYLPIAYVALAPELQKQAAEKQAGSTSPSSSTSPSTSPSSPSTETTSSPPALSASANSTVPQQSNSTTSSTTTTPTTTISNDISIGKQVKSRIQDVKTEVAAEKPGTAWFGLGALAGVFGGGGGKSGGDNKQGNESFEGEGKK